MRRKGIKGLLAAAALSMLLAGSALAQRRGGFGMMGGGGGLLARAEVQAELKLTEEQKTQVTDLLQKLNEERQGRMQGLISATPDERQKMIADMQADEKKRVDAILTAEQQKRFKEISLQQQGLSALASAPIADELKLTDDQRAKVRDLMEQRMTALRDAFQNAGGDREAMRAKIEELRKDTDTKIEALLTDEQRARWKTMLGTPFALPARGA